MPEIISATGVIATNTTWSTGSTITLTSDVQIDTGVTLTVQPGVTINANGHQFLIIGDLVMDGTPDQKITLNNATLNFGNYPNAPGYVLLDNVRMTGGNFLPATGSGGYGHFDLTQSAFTGVGGFYIWYPTSNSTISQNIFDQSAGLSTGINGATALTIANNVFASQTTAYAVENWANYNGLLNVTGNSFLSTDKVALALPDGYTSASMLAENNYFGTTNPATINAMVLDRNDSLTRNAAIDISPWLNTPSTDTPSFTLNYTPVPLAAPINHPTILLSNTIWTTGSTITLMGDVQVDTGVTLTVQPGVTINANGHQFLVIGDLVMDGTPDQKITLNNATLNIGNYPNAPGYILLDNVRMIGGNLLPATGNGSYGHFDLAHSVFTSVGGFYIWYPTSSSTISQNIFDHSAGLSTGISGATALTITNNVFASQTTAYAVENWADYNGLLTVTGNSFLSTDKVALALRDGYTSASMAAENNYFGTTNPATINAMVLDRNDSLTRNAVIDISITDEPSSQIAEAIAQAGPAVTLAIANLGYIIGSPTDDNVAGTNRNENIFGSDGGDTISGGSGNDFLSGGAHIDTAVFSGNRAAYAVSQPAIGRFTVTGPDGTDTLANIEYLRFADQTVRLLRGSGAAVDFAADPATYMAGIRDFDGNNLGGAGGWLRIGSADVNGDGDTDQVLVNRTIARFAEVGTAPDGLVYFGDHGWAGETRVVGIYIDPLVQSGQVVAGSDHDSQRRFQNDLSIENINRVLGAGDYDHDGLQEVYFGLTDGTAYLHAYMHADGNIRYANYQDQTQVIDFLTTNGWASSTYDGWFG